MPASPPTLVWLGPPFFAPYMRDLGWRIVQKPHDLAAPRSFTDILALSGGVVPDAVVVADASTPPLVLGVEDFPCLTVFYAVDSHIHSWYPLYAQGFDLCLVSLKDHLSLFTTGRLSSEDVHWSPPFALDHHRPPADGVAPQPLAWDLLFVGTVDPEITPKRYSFISELQKALPSLHVTRGSFPTLFPQARLLLNECSHADLNFRVFEALGCGGCLLTPRIGHGLTDIFTHGKELFIYPPFDVPALMEIVLPLLQDESLRCEVARQGLAAVDAAHRASHRARNLHNILAPLIASQESEHKIHSRRALAPQIREKALRLLYLHHAETVGVPALQRAYLTAAKGK